MTKNGQRRDVPGLSPLTRGNLPAANATFSASGPIPAHAGEPPLQSRLRRLQGAYPRSRGGTQTLADLPAPAKGLSPLTRGNRIAVKSINVPLGPIPAHAGEPNSNGSKFAVSWAYPRSRGGTLIPSTAIGDAKGLSPLTRGNLRCGLNPCFLPGPIPAHAGEPGLDYARSE